ncbi:hypothetical protein PRIPAC_82076 [Pristionchus pacificus]|uniref:Uncharacterized protein n=1 Tax=Pristionchus pacificus TaxID=54126 RepID=A0A2A6CJE7_PRIPA|nr:hypothetical protein PRIPAC_82076 [Pristionchus pacificus]|eukprot:PDM78208.1 hypothetical protein PRIPAC_30787 [Pristionchus pacificus]
MHAHTWLWAAVAIVFVPSFIVHCALLILAIRERKSKNAHHYKTLFYRLFVTQGVIELVLLSIYLVVKILIKERLAGDDFILKSIRNRRADVQLGLVGCVHLLAQCLMAACHLIVMCSLNNLTAVGFVNPLAQCNMTAYHLIVVCNVQNRHFKLLFLHLYVILLRDPLDARDHGQALAKAPDQVLTR